jgi:hypothetical protein
MDIANLKLQKLYVFIKLIKQIKYNNSSNLDSLLNNDIFNSINKEIYIPSNIQDICNGDLNTDIKNGILYFKTILPDYEDLLNKVLLNEPNIEIVVPLDELRFHYYSDREYLSLGDNTGYGSQNISRKYNIDITHYLLEFTNQKDHIFAGLYYHDHTNPDKDNIEQIKLKLLDRFNREKEYFDNGGGVSTFGPEPYTEINSKIEKINSEEFWKKDRYFLINKIVFNFGLNKSIKIENLISTLAKKGHGHILLCLLMYILLYKIKFDINKVKLK